MARLAQVCVHVAAVLFKVEAAVKYGFTVRASCKWNKQFRKEIITCPVSEMGSELIKSKRKVLVTTVYSSSQDPLPNIEVLNSLKNGVLYFQLSSPNFNLVILTPLRKMTLPILFL